MSFADRALLQNIRDEVNFILTYTAEKSKDEFINDPVLSRAVVRSLEIIGEAARKIGPEVKAQQGEIEWKKMAGTRDRLIHNYEGIDYDIVWNLIEEKLPVLKQQLETILSRL